MVMQVLNSSSLVLTEKADAGRFDFACASESYFVTFDDAITFSLRVPLNITCS